MANVREADQIPNPGPRHQVIRVGASQRASFVILSKSMWRVWTHWDEYRRRTIPCLDDRAACEGCQKEMPLRFKAYVYVYSVADSKQVFLELTPVAAKQLEQQSPASEPYRGLTIDVERGKGAKAHVNLTVRRYQPRCENIPAELDPRPILIALWNMPDRRKRFAGEARQSDLDTF